MKKMEKPVWIGWLLFGLVFLFLQPEGAAAFLEKCRVLVSPLLGAILLAFLLDLPTSFFEKKLKTRDPSSFWRRHARSAALCLVLLLFAAVLLLFFLAVLPKLWLSLQELFGKLPEYWEATRQTVQTLLEKLPDSLPFRETIQNFFFAEQEIPLASVTAQTGNVLQSAFYHTSQFTKGAARFVIALVLACYFVCGKQTLLLQARSVLTAFCSHRRCEQILAVQKLCFEIFAHFVSRQCLEALILGSLCFLGMVLLRLPYALPICAVIAVSAVIPVLGSLLGGGVGVLLLLLIDPLDALEFLTLFLVLQNIEGNFIYPRVVGSSLGLPPVWSVLAVFLGGSLWGIPGIFFSVPAGSVLYRLFRERVFQKLRQKGLDTEDLAAIFYREQRQTTLSSEPLAKCAQKQRQSGKK